MNSSEQKKRMETPDQVVKKARPFFLGYFQQLANDLNTLIDAPVICSLNGINLLRGEGDLGTLFEMDRSVAYAREDGLDTGDVHLVFDVTTSIALAGLMMMMGESVIQNKLKIREYNEEIQEGFQEVSNQIVGALNDQVETRMDDGGHLLLEDTSHVGFGEMASTLEMDNTYLAAEVEIKVADFGAATAHWLLSRGVAEAILGVLIPGSDKELAADAAKKGGDAVASVDDDEFAVEHDAAADEESDKEDGVSAAVKRPDGSGPGPDEPGSVKDVMTETSFSMKDDEPIKRAIVAMLQDGYRYIAVERKGVMVRVVSQSDLRQIMGPFYGSNALSARDKAIYALGIGKLNEKQKLIKISQDGTINQAADLITGHHLRALPVVSNKGVVRGFVPVHAIVDYFRGRQDV